MCTRGSVGERNGVIDRPPRGGGLTGDNKFRGKPPFGEQKRCRCHKGRMMGCEEGEIDGCKSSIRRLPIRRLSLLGSGFIDLLSVSVSGFVIVFRKRGRLGLTLRMRGWTGGGLARGGRLTS